MKYQEIVLTNIQKNYLLLTNEVYFRDEKQIHYLKLNKYNLLYQQCKEAKSYDHINQFRKIVDKI